MDWNKTKTIFIIVFSILNVFLYSMYVNRYEEVENTEFLVELSNEEKLEANNITYSDLPETVENKPYVTGEEKTFLPEDVQGDNRQVTIRDDKFLSVSFKKPVVLNDMEGTEALEEFVEKNVYEGENYVLWKIDEKEKKAVFFQKINGETLFYSENGQLAVYWNDKEEVIRYEQTLFDNVTESEQVKELITPIQAISTLNQRRILQTDTTIDSVEIGYSEFVPVSESTQMFLPTWRIEATLEDGTEEEYFVNAVKDGVIELKKDDEEEEKEENEENVSQ